jgi:hypothetical protein
MVQCRRATYAHDQDRGWLVVWPGWGEQRERERDDGDGDVGVQGRRKLFQVTLVGGGLLVKVGRREVLKLLRLRLHG